MTQIANTYGQALYDLAKEEELTGEILGQLQVLQQAFAQEPDFLRLLSLPSLSKAERCQILDHSFRDQTEPYLLNFMKILTEKGYMRYFGDCCRAYARCYDQDHGILPVEAVSAVTLTAQQVQKLTEKLSAFTGKTIRLTSRIDPAVLGGLRLDYDGRRVDGTVKNRLDSIGNLLKNTVL